MAGLAATFGSGAMTNSIGEMDDADLFFVLGSNTTEQHPLVAARIIQAVQRGARLIVADPRKTQIASLAHVHLRHAVGSDVALVNGLMNIILQNGWEDRAFINGRTENFQALESVVSEYDEERVSSITGLSKKSIVEAAALYAQSPKAMIVYAMGITQHVAGTDNVKSLANLAMVTGHVGRPSSGVNPLRGQNNVQGACDMGALPSVFSGYQAVSDPEAIRCFEEEWAVKGLSPHPGLTATEMVEAIDNGQLKALYVIGENPVVSDPDSQHVYRALKKLELLVVQDIFMSETAELADVILPAASFAEKTGTYTNTERRVQLSRQAIDPLPGVLPDWRIICEVGSRAGYPMHYEDIEEVAAEIARTTPSYAGISYDRLRDSWGIQWPCPDNGHPGTMYLHKEKFAKGRGTFMPAVFVPPEEPPDAEFPYILTTGRVGAHYHTGTISKRTLVLNREVPYPYLEINPEDAKRLRVRTGMKVAVESRRGEISLPVQVTEKVPKGVVFGSFHFNEANVNRLIPRHLDPVSKIPELKHCAVNIRRL